MLRTGRLGLGKVDYLIIFAGLLIVLAVAGAVWLHLRR